MGLILSAILFAFVAFFSWTDSAMSRSRDGKAKQERSEPLKPSGAERFETASFGMG